ncbi:MAG TPA: ferrous iron transport protein A [Nannocystis exedens]|nr:ferrous iron transport protein A [Nannocystis exedens]
MSPSTLASLEIGADAQVVDVTGADSLRLRLIEMGFVPGTTVRVVKRAPFGDPLELRLRGGHISLRAAEAARISISSSNSREHSE